MGLAATAFLTMSKEKCNVNMDHVTYCSEFLTVERYTCVFFNATCESVKGFGNELNMEKYALAILNI